MVHFEFGGFGHVMNPYLVLSFALFWFMYSWMVIFCCEANWFCAVRMSIARWISCFIAMVCGFGHVQYCTLIMNSWMRSFALAVHVLLVTNCKLFVGKWLRPRYIRLRVKWVCCDSIMHDAEADFDVNRIVLVINCPCTWYVQAWSSYALMDLRMTTIIFTMFFMLIIPTGSFLYAGIYSQKEMIGDVARWIKNADEIRK